MSAKTSTEHATVGDEVDPWPPANTPVPDGFHWDGNARFMRDDRGGWEAADSRFRWSRSGELLFYPGNGSKSGYHVPMVGALNVLNSARQSFFKTYLVALAVVFFTSICIYVFSLNMHKIDGLGELIGGMETSMITLAGGGFLYIALWGFIKRPREMRFQRSLSTLREAEFLYLEKRVQSVLDKPSIWAYLIVIFFSIILIPTAIFLGYIFLFREFESGLTEYGIVPYYILLISPVWILLIVVFMWWKLLRSARAQRNPEPEETLPAHRPGIDVALHKPEAAQTSKSLSDVVLRGVISASGSGKQSLGQRFGGRFMESLESKLERLELWRPQTRTDKTKKWLLNQVVGLISMLVVGTPVFVAVHFGIQLAKKLNTLL